MNTEVEYLISRIIHLFQRGPATWDAYICLWRTGRNPTPSIQDIVVVSNDPLTTARTIRVFDPIGQPAANRTPTPGPMMNGPYLGRSPSAKRKLPTGPKPEILQRPVCTSFHSCACLFFFECVLICCLLVFFFFFSRHDNAAPLAKLSTMEPRCVPVCMSTYSVHVASLCFSTCPCACNSCCLCMLDFICEMCLKCICRLNSSSFISALSHIPAGCWELFKNVVRLRAAFTHQRCLLFLLLPRRLDSFEAEGAGPAG